MGLRILELTLVSAKDLKDVGSRSREMSPYAVAHFNINGCSIRSATAKRGGTDPVWNSKLTFVAEKAQLRDPEALIEIQLLHSSSAGDVEIGVARIKSKYIPASSSTPSTDTFQVYRASGRAQGFINVSMRLVRVGQDSGKPTERGQVQEYIPHAAPRTSHSARSQREEYPEERGHDGRGQPRSTQQIPSNGYGNVYNSRSEGPVRSSNPQAPWLQPPLRPVLAQPAAFPYHATMAPQRQIPAARGYPSAQQGGRRGGLGQGGMIAAAAAGGLVGGLLLDDAVGFAGDAVGFAGDAFEYVVDTTGDAADAVFDSFGDLDF